LFKIKQRCISKKILIFALLRREQKKKLPR
jgi:hypothetical protein